MSSAGCGRPDDSLVPALEIRGGYYESHFNGNH